MIWIILSLFSLILAGACNAIVDTVDHHQSKSIFSKLKNQRWWNQSQGWKNKYIDYDGDMKKKVEPRLVQWEIFGKSFNKPVQLSDSWHFFKMLMLTFLWISWMLPVIPLLLNLGVTEWYYHIIMISTWGFLWILSFNTFYNKILLRK